MSDDSSPGYSNRRHRLALDSHLNSQRNFYRNRNFNGDRPAHLLPQRSPRPLQHPRLPQHNRLQQLGQPLHPIYLCLQLVVHPKFPSLWPAVHLCRHLRPAVHLLYRPDDLFGFHISLPRYLGRLLRLVQGRKHQHDRQGVWYEFDRQWMFRLFLAEELFGDFGGCGAGWRYDDGVLFGRY